jgi:hypothetical protein|uniref:Uncharacterized protein n=1 Tax=Oryza sativa subsp. japonica TaxID=39947 RepID=Q6H8H6_ORYSJ|nr:hypothetical protein [Oryza sativa Japonica Group]
MQAASAIQEPEKGEDEAAKLPKAEHLSEYVSNLTVPRPHERTRARTGIIKSSRFLESNTYDHQGARRELIATLKSSPSSTELFFFFFFFCVLPVHHLSDDHDDCHAVRQGSSYSEEACRAM